MPRLSKPHLTTIGAAAALGALLICLWLARGPIGVWAATDYLRRKGVPANITVERLTFSGFKGALRLGPAGDPDLAASRVEVDYALFPGRKLGLRVTAVRLSGVTAKLAYDGQRLRYGSLQKLIDDALATPPSPLPGPRVRFERATVRLTTPAGAVAVAGDGEIDDARVRRLDLSLSAPALKAAGLSAEGVAGTLTAAGGERLRAQLALSARGAATDKATDKVAGKAAARGLTLNLTADLPYGRTDSLAGPASVGAVLRAAALEAAGWSGQAATARLDLNGALSGKLDAPRYSGVASASLDADAAKGPGLALAGAAASLASQSFDLAFGKDGLTAGGPLSGRASVAGGGVDVGGRRLDLAEVDLRGSGQVRLSPTGLEGEMTGGLDARGGFAATQARGLADLTFPPDLDAVSNAALRRALAGLRLTAPRYRLALSKAGAQLSLPQPARLAFDGGALTVASLSAAAGADGTTGAAKAVLAATNLPRLDLAVGRYRASPAGFEASGRLSVEGALFGLQGARLAPDFRLTQAGDSLNVVLPGCAPFTLAGYGAPDPILKDAKGQLCPADRPLVAVRGTAWRSTVALREVEAALPTAEAAFAEGAGSAGIRGAAGAPLRGDLMLDAGRLTDAAKEVRFAPLKVSGRFALEGDLVSGDVGAGPGAPIATARISHDIAKGTGRAVLAPTAILFAPDGLQPAQLSPAAALLTKADGAAQASATVIWSKDALDGVARVSTEGMALTTPAGRLTGVKGAVDFTSLVPALVTAPGQRITAAKLDAVTPLTDLDIRFAMNGEALTLNAASATLAKGKASLDPMTVPLAPNAAMTGTMRLADVDLGEILAGFNLSDSVTMQARIEALLPFSLSPDGLRFKEGRIAATGPGRLSIKRAALTGVAATAAPTAPGAPPPAPTPTNAVQDFAYQALENLAFDQLEAKVDSRPQGRLGVVFHLKGRNDPPTKQKAKIKVTDLARGTAFDKPIPLPSGTPVDLTLDTSLNFDDLMAAYARIGRSDAVQPPDR